MTTLQQMAASRRLRTTLAAAVATVALAACGGGGGDGGTTATNGNNGGGSGVPNSATSSMAGLMAYMATLIGSSSDTAEPVTLGDAKLPSDDTSEAASN